MTVTPCSAPLALEALVAYLAGELDAAEEAALEQHYFGCEHCARRLSMVERLGAGVADLVARGELTAIASAALVDAMQQRGLALRQYTLRPGESVNCTAAPRDDVLVVRLAADPAALGAREPDAEETLSLDVAAEDLSGGDFAVTRTLPAVLDHESGQVVLLFPGALVRSYPRSRWTMTLSRAGGAPAGPYVMLHTPWEQLDRR